MASISSKKRMQGADCLAFLKRLCRAFSDSPSHFEKRRGALTDIKFNPVSPANALAIRVFPVPEGPVKSIPLGGKMLPSEKRFGYFEGQSTTERSASFILCNPP